MIALTLRTLGAGAALLALLAATGLMQRGVP